MQCQDSIESISNNQQATQHIMCTAQQTQQEFSSAQIVIVESCRILLATYDQTVSPIVERISVFVY